MKQNERLSYSYFKQVEHDSKLGTLFNLAIQKMSLSRAVCAPERYPSGNKELADMYERNSIIFYELCLGELYMHSIIDNLSNWITITNEYNNSFNSSWKYYASSKRIECINKYGGDDYYDFNEDGTINVNVDDEALKYYTVVNDLIPDSWRDIFMSTRVGDLEVIYNSIATYGNFNLKEMFSSIGHDLKTYKHEDGNIIENTWADEIINKTERSVAAESIGTGLMYTFKAVNDLIDEVKSLPITEDNKGFFLSLPNRIDNIFNLKIK